MQVELSAEQIGILLHAIGLITALKNPNVGDRARLSCVTSLANSSELAATKQVLQLAWGSVQGVSAVAGIPGVLEGDR